MYCKCGNIIPEKRTKLGYKTCVKCSTEDKWGCHQVVYHKTGNTIEVIKDKELCETINAMSQRTAFGVCKGMTGNFRKRIMVEKEPVFVETKPLHRIINKYKPDPKTYDFEGTGEKALEIYEKLGYKETEHFLIGAVQMLKISPDQKKQIETILYELYETKQ